MRDKPNILLIMGDQMAPQSLPVYGHKLVKTPAIERLAADGAVFDNAYCNFPLCAPSRFSMLSGRLASRIGAYDNAAEFPSEIPTIAHYLRLGGYKTCLAGKMHFIGADQLHGYEQRITTDIYPADFGWTPDWEHPERRLEWFHNLVNVAAAGPSERTLQIDYDDETAFGATRWLYDHARGTDERPFFLTASFSHPHDPYNIPREYWDRYDHDAIDLTTVKAIPPEDRDPHSRRLWENYDRDQFAITDELIRNARHAYYGSISYVDDQVATLMEALEATGQRDNTIVIFTADHGDMLGERGLWFKMSFFERAARVPLIVNAPGRIAARRIGNAASLVDLLPTVLGLTGGDAAESDGRDLTPLLAGDGGGDADIALGEYTAEGTDRPIFMVRRGRYKYIAGPGDPPQLYDVAGDPNELANLAGDPAHATAEAELAVIVTDTWDADDLTTRVIASQRRRRMVFDAVMTGSRNLWDYNPPRDGSVEYVRNIGGLYEKEARAFLPRRPELEPNNPG